jgi:hypothetical protein
MFFMRCACNVDKTQCPCLYFVLIRFVELHQNLQWFRRKKGVVSLMHCTNFFCRPCVILTMEITVFFHQYFDPLKMFEQGYYASLERRAK